jgi:pimeloyl-ACP methyl ester carboxylesterase
MGRVEDFEGDSVTCDGARCGKHERVATGQVPTRWLRGQLDGVPGTYDACGTNCAALINKQLVMDPDAEHKMTWWSSLGEAVETIVGPSGWTMKMKGKP